MTSIKELLEKRSTYTLNIIHTSEITVCSFAGIFYALLVTMTKSPKPTFQATFGHRDQKWFFLF